MLKLKTIAFAAFTLFGRSYRRWMLPWVFFLMFPHASFAGEFRVIKAFSGDTIKVRGEYEAFDVRLVGIDAPELSSKRGQKDQPFSREAKTYLENLILNKRVSIKGHGEKDFGLVWGEVYFGDKNVSLEMLRAGYAVVYLENSLKGMDLSRYYVDEKEAKGAKKGMWALGEKYVEPVKWRKRNKTRRSIATILYGILHQVRNTD